MSNKKRIIISVTNDITTDNRIRKVAQSLFNSGFEITIVGRKLKNSLSIDRPYKIKRFRLLFTKGALFYASYNFRLFLFLLFQKADIFLSNDLDTLLANYLASRIRNKPLVYDSHELFIEVPELVDRPKVQKIWLAIEKRILPKLKNAYTVCDSIADYYKKKYGVEMEVVRNIPICGETKFKNKKSEKNILIYQGALNKARGIETMISAMQFVENAELWIVGSGDIEQQLRQLLENLAIKDKVKFYGRIKPEDLTEITNQATLGFSLEQNIGLNYYYALPNKIFDYINAGVPVLCSNFPEMERIVKTYDIGETIEPSNEKELAKMINQILSDKTLLDKWKKNLQKAQKELCWQNEEKKLLKIFFSL